MTDKDTEFREFILKISETEDEHADFETTISGINEVINEHYYEGSDESHIMKVGSIGRKTNISATSDHDVLCVLPAGVKERFEGHKHAQSDLLQEVKGVLQKRYSRTVIRGDGQVVSIELKKGTIELVPGFCRDDGEYDYPNTNHGGTWETTDPINQIKQAKNDEVTTAGRFLEVAKAIRAWRDHQGLILKGIVIDSVLDECYSENIELGSDLHYLNHLKSVFDKMSNMNDGKVIALGTDDEMDNDDIGFIKAAGIATEAIIADEGMGSTELMTMLFGSQYNQRERAANEEYVEERFKLALRYQLRLDAIITENGFRAFSLKRLLRQRHLLRIDRKIHFYVSDSTIPMDLEKSVKYFWKVRNRGIKARNKERGSIFRDRKEHDETSTFNGDHYVEVYAVVNGAVIARAHIDVPIDSLRGIDEIA